jgi:peroxiredoxin
MPDLDALYTQFKGDGLVVVSVSDETPERVVPYIQAHPVTYPILLDPGRTVNDAYRIEGIPKSIVYDREGKIVAQAIDMRTKRQFLEMLAAAGLK